MASTWLTSSVTGVIGIAIGACAVTMLRGVESGLADLSQPEAISSAEHPIAEVDTDCNDQEAVIEVAPEQHVLTSSSPAIQGLGDEPLDDERAIAVAVREANAIVQESLRRGEWTIDDGERLREHYRLLPEDERTELLSLLVTAVNRGDLIPQSSRFPF